MSDERPDTELLSDYCKTGSRGALGELARRHAGLVYSAARRRVGDAHLAEDVAQAVFILLARRARTIRNPAALVGWLYNTTHFAAANAMKMENRRKFHEKQAAKQNHSDRAGAEPNVWPDLMPIIDDAMRHLGQSDRQSILLRYFSGKSVLEVAMATGVSEAAAKKRLSRGLEKLRKVLSGKGLSISAGVLAAALTARAAEAGPITLQAMIPTLVAGQCTSASPTARLIADKLFHPNLHWAAIAAGLTLLTTAALIGASLVIKQQNAIASAQSPVPSYVQPAGGIAGLSKQPTTAPIASALTIQLPGTITGSPTLVDITGDGKPVIIVPAMGMIPRASSFLPPDPRIDPAAKLYAFHLDGTPVADWPLTIMTAENHLAARSDSFPNWWESTPAVINATPTTPSIIVISHPSGPSKADRGATVIRGDQQSITKLSTALAMPDPGSTLTLADLQNKGAIDILGGGTACTLDNKMIPGFPAKHVPSGFCASVADLTGNGQLDFIEVTERHGPINGTVTVFDPTGKRLRGWPQKIGAKSFSAPSLGKVYADGKMQIIVPDLHGHILAWTADGSPFGQTFAEDVGHDSNGQQLSPPQGNQEKCTSIFKDNIDTAGPVALADLDGDGLAEIIVVDSKTATLRAWHGDGTGFANPDGIIAHLPPGDVFGVSVAGPDQNGAFDFFAGNSWVHRDADGLVDVRPMIHPNSSQLTIIPTEVDVECQDTIADLGDGKATILIGTADGRLVLFPTNLKYTPQWAQWPMLGCNPQRTACWQPPHH